MTELTGKRRVAIFDRVPALRYGLECRFAAEGFEVVASASDAKTAIRVLSEDRQIDLVVTDIDLELETAFEVIESVKQLKLATKFVIFTDLRDAVYVVNAVKRCNVSGYIVKTDPLQRLIDALHMALANRQDFSTGIDVKLTIDEFGRHAAFAEDPLSRLSLRQLEVFRLLAMGDSIKEVGVRLGCSRSAADGAAFRVHQRLGIRSRAELVTLGIATGVAAPRVVVRSSGK